jgi:sulfur carrier protein ThiS
MILVNQFKKVVWRKGITVADVLAELGWDYVLITTTVNGEFVPTGEYSSFQVPDEADMRAIHIAHGG